MKVIINNKLKNIKTNQEIDQIIFENKEIKYIKIIKTRNEFLLLKQNETLQVILSDKNQIRKIVLKKDKKLMIEYIKDHFTKNTIQMELIWDKMIPQKVIKQRKLIVFLILLILISLLVYYFSSNKEITKWLISFNSSFLLFYIGRIQYKNAKSDFISNRAAASIVMGIIMFLGSLYWIVHGFIDMSK